MKKTGKILAALGLAVAFGAILNPTQAKAEDTDRIAQGVYIGNIDVGGMTEQEALNAVTDYVNNAGEAVFTLTAGEHIQKKQKRMPPSRRTGSSSSRAGHRPEWHCRGLQSSRRAPAAPPSARNSEVRTVEKFSWKSPPIGSACPARKCARQVGCSFAMNCFDCTGSCPVCKGAVRGKICPMTALGKFFVQKACFLPGSMVILFGSIVLYCAL